MPACGGIAGSLTTPRENPRFAARDLFTGYEVVFIGTVSHLNELFRKTPGTLRKKTHKTASVCD
jgi:hypothetical protein